MNRFDSLVHATRDGSWIGTSRHDVSIDRLIRELDHAGVARACLVGIPRYADNETVARAAAAYPGRFVPIGGIDPTAHADSAAVEDAVAQLAAQHFAGIKLHPRLGGYDPLDPRALAAIRAAGKRGLAAFVCTLSRRPDAPTRHPADIVDHLATACRDTRIVLLHGGGTAMMDLFELVRMHHHLLLDLSFSVLRYRGSSLDLDMRFLCEHLDQRLVVGSDFPEFTPAEAFARVDELIAGLPAAKRENILHGNLTRLFETWTDRARQSVIQA